MGKVRFSCYAVAVGRRVGVYNTWSECEAQVKGYRGAIFKGFTCTRDARNFINSSCKPDHGPQADHHSRGPYKPNPVHHNRPDEDKGELAVLSLDEEDEEELEYYAVVRGRETGVYLREEAEKQIDGFPNAYYNFFSTYGEARRFLDANRYEATATPPSVVPQAYSAVHDTHRGKYYAVAVGKTPGIYYDWPTCAIQVKGFSGARYKSFRTHAEAEAFVRQYGNHFAMVPDFRPDNSAPFDDEFDRFASSQGIKPGSQEYRKQRTTAISREFDVLYLSQPIKEEKEEDESDCDDMDIKEEEPLSREELLLRAFQDLCRQVHLEPRNTALECAMAIKDVGLINIIDFIDTKRTQKPVSVWPWSRFMEFRDYTLGGGKCMNLGIAKKNDILRALLQNLTSNQAIEHARVMAAQEQQRRVALAIGRVAMAMITQRAIKEDESKQPMNSISRDTPQAIKTEDDERSVKRESSQLPIFPTTTTTTTASSPPLIPTTSGHSLEESSREPAVKRESPQLSPTPPSAPTNTFPPTPDTACKPRPGDSSQPIQLESSPPKRPAPKAAAAAATRSKKEQAPPATPVRRSARLAATKTSPKGETEEVCMKDIPRMMITPVTQPKKRKAACVIEIPDSDDDEDVPAAKKMKQATLDGFVSKN